MSAPKLLLVEDDTALAELVEYRFRGEGYDVRSTRSGVSSAASSSASSPSSVVRTS